MPESVPIEALLPRFDNQVVATAVHALTWLREHFPDAHELVYDTHAVSCSFSTTGKLGGVFVGVVLYSKHVNLSFPRGAALHDPEGLLVGKGARFRHVRLTASTGVDTPGVQRLIVEASVLAGA